MVKLRYREISRLYLVVRDSLLDPGLRGQVSKVGRHSGLHGQSCQQRVLAKPLGQTLLTDDSFAQEGASYLAVVATLSARLVSVDVEPLVFVIETVGLLEVLAVSDGIQHIPGFAVLLICKRNLELGC